MRTVGQPDRARDARDLLHHDDVREIAEAGTPEALGYGDAEQSLLTQRRPEVARKFVAAVNFRRARGDLLGGEAPHLLADLFQLRGQSEVLIDVVECAHGLAFPAGMIV